LVARDADGVKLRAYPTQDGARAAELTLQSTPATLILHDGLAHLERAVDIGIAALAAEGVGAMEKLLALTVEYMNTRKQFGVPIATFQALRHRVADCKMQLELARSMSYFASLKLGEEPAARRHAIAQAKVQLGNSTRFVGQQCIQLHGGIGVTDEYIGSHYFKRLTCMELSFGDTLHHLGVVSEGMKDTAGVMRWLDGHGHGLAVGPARVPIVPAAVLFDLWLQTEARIRPDADAGYAACAAASVEPPAQGCVGAGAGATLGKLFGIERAMKGGIGTASIRVGAITVGALVAVNAIGDVIDPATGQAIAGARTPHGRGLVNSTEAFIRGQ